MVVTTVFVGRDRELAALREALTEADGGRAHVVVVEGEAGSGKTTLVAELLKEAAGRLVLYASGDESESELAWAAISQLAACVEGNPRRMLGALATSTDQADPTVIGGQLLTALGDLQAESRTVIVVIDDAGLIDAPSSKALLFAARRLLSDRVLVIVTSRPGHLPAGWQQIVRSLTGQQLTLTGLAPAELRQLSVALGAGDLSSSAIERLHLHTDGNPLHACELLLTFGAAVVEPVASDDPLPVPPEMSEVVIKTWEHCGPDTRRLVAAAAVLGRRSRLGDVLAVADVGEPVQAGAVDEAIAARLLVRVASDPADMEFAHALVRSAVYHHLPAAERRFLHARAGGLGTAPRHLAHRVAATVGADEALAATLEAAADGELAGGRYRAAADLLSQAAKTSPAGPDGDRRLLRAATELLVAQEVGRAVDLGALVRATRPGPHRDYVTGFLALMTGGFAEARSCFERSWDAIQAGATHDGPTGLDGRIAYQLAIIATFELHSERMLTWSERAVAATAADPRMSSLAWFSRYFALGIQGRGAEALALPNARDAPPGLDLLVGRGLVELWNDDLNGARRHLHEASVRAQRGEPLRVPQALAMLGEAEYRLGRFDEAIVHTELAVATAEDLGRFWDFPFLHALAAYPRAARGEWAEAEAHVEASTRWSELVPVAETQTYAAGARIALALARDDPAALLEAAEAHAAVYDLSEPGTSVFGPVRAEALLGLGRPDEASEALERFGERADRVGRRSAQLGCARLRVTIEAARGNLDDADAAYAMGCTLAADLALPLEAARLHDAGGRALVAAGRTDEARDRLDQALRAFEDLGAAPYAARSRAALSAIGHERTGRHPTSLTPTQVVVAHLVADGLTNREIAEQLVVSVKAVEYHLTRAYRALGVRSRTGLMNALAHHHL